MVGIRTNDPGGSANHLGCGSLNPPRMQLQGIKSRYAEWRSYWLWEAGLTGQWVTQSKQPGVCRSTGDGWRSTESLGNTLSRLKPRVIGITKAKCEQRSAWVFLVRKRTCAGIQVLSGHREHTGNTKKINKFLGVLEWWLHKEVTQ